MIRWFTIIALASMVLWFGVITPFIAQYNARVEQRWWDSLERSGFLIKPSENISLEAKP